MPTNPRLELVSFLVQRSIDPAECKRMFQEHMCTTTREDLIDTLECLRDYRIAQPIQVLLGTTRLPASQREMFMEAAQSILPIAYDHMCKTLPLEEEETHGGAQLVLPRKFDSNSYQYMTRTQQEPVAVQHYSQYDRDRLGGYADNSSSYQYMTRTQQEPVAVQSYPQRNSSTRSSTAHEESTGNVQMQDPMRGNSRLARGNKGPQQYSGEIRSHHVHWGQPDQPQGGEGSWQPRGADMQSTPDVEEESRFQRNPWQYSKSTTQQGSGEDQRGHRQGTTASTRFTVGNGIPLQTRDMPPFSPGKEHRDLEFLEGMLEAALDNCNEEHALSLLQRIDETKGRQARNEQAGRAKGPKVDKGTNLLSEREFKDAIQGKTIDELLLFQNLLDAAVSQKQTKASVQTAASSASPGSPQQQQSDVERAATRALQTLAPQAPAQGWGWNFWRTSSKSDTSGNSSSNDGNCQKRPYVSDPEEQEATSPAEPRGRARDESPPRREETVAPRVDVPRRRRNESSPRRDQPAPSPPKARVQAREVPRSQPEGTGAPPVDVPHRRRNESSPRRDQPAPSPPKARVQAREVPRSQPEGTGAPPVHVPRRRRNESSPRREEPIAPPPEARTWVREGPRPRRVETVAPPAGDQAQARIVPALQEARGGAAGGASLIGAEQLREMIARVRGQITAAEAARKATGNV